MGKADGVYSNTYIGIATPPDIDKPIEEPTNPTVSEQESDMDIPEDMNQQDHEYSHSNQPETNGY